MDEEGFRRILREETQAIRDEVQAVRNEVQAVRDETRAIEQRLTENARLQFRQLADLYRSTLEKIDLMDKHVGERLDRTRGAIEALRSSLERQDFRSDELGRRITTLETRREPL
jgi:uncharacterized coiled-coil DUF342 family protein